MPGVYAQRLYARTHTSGRTKSVQDAPTTNDHDCTDAEPTKHTQPFIVGKGFGNRDRDRNREFSIFVKFNFPQNFGRTSCPADIFIYLTIFYDINQDFISSPKKRTAFSLQILIASSVGIPFISASFSAVLCVIELSQRLPLNGTGAI